MTDTIDTHGDAEITTARLALEDGSVFEGRALGAIGTASGEICFNTSMMGYQEILTDPSYRGQIVTMTYPLIGNYGVCPEDTESDRVQVAGFIVREPCGRPSNCRSADSLHQYLLKNTIVGISHIDTRALTRKLRINGVMNGVLSSEITDPDQLLELTSKTPGLVGRDLVTEVVHPDTQQWTRGYESAFAGPIAAAEHGLKRRKEHSDSPTIVAFDCGIKHNICRNLITAGFNLTILPADASAEQVLEHKPDGIFVSNGPGDPVPIEYAIKTIQALIQQEIPMFGICLGVELIGLALGGDIFKLKYGHRGGNHPVKNLDTGKVEITAQNHGFAVDIDSLPKNDVRLTHVNLNDQTLEGIAHKQLPIFAVQYHPEASPGPHDATYLFEAFHEMVQTGLPVQFRSQQYA